MKELFLIVQDFPKNRVKNNCKIQFYCVNTSYPMDNMLNRSAQTGPPNIRKRRPVFPPAGRSSYCTRQVAHRTSFLSRQPDVIASFSFGACTACTEYLELWNFFKFCEFVEVFYLTTLLFTSIHIIDYNVFSQPTSTGLRRNDGRV